MKDSKLELRVLTGLTLLGMVLDVVLCVMVPFLLKRFGFERMYVGPLWLMGLALFAALWQLLGILREVGAGRPFVQKNVNYLKRIALCCFAVAVAFALMEFVYADIVKILMAVCALTAGLLLRVLAWVFELGVMQRAENDLTI